tara:strand:- start:130729 stop:130929 length:201 start_codon:yes stop_codon:yes gene_type:complete
MSRPLYVDGKDLESLQQESFLDSDRVVYNLVEDIICLKEELSQAIDIIEECGIDYEEMLSYREDYK